MSEVITNAYDYFTPIEDALAAVFTANEIVCYTPLGRQPEGAAEAAEEVRSEHKLPRPRVELMVQPGASLGNLQPQSGRQASAGHLRERARRSTVIIAIITTDNVRQHREFLCFVLSILDTIGHDVNDTRRLHNQNVQSFRVGPGTTEYDQTEGFLKTELPCEMDFSTQLYALTALE